VHGRSALSFIQNVSLDDIVKAWHYDPGVNSMLIQIVDVERPTFPKPLYVFKETHQFRFDDIDEGLQQYVQVRQRRLPICYEKLLNYE